MNPPNWMNSAKQVVSLMHLKPLNWPALLKGKENRKTVSKVKAKNKQ